MQSESDVLNAELCETAKRNHVILMTKFEKSTKKLQLRCQQCNTTWSDFAHNLKNGKWCKICRDTTDNNTSNARKIIEEVLKRLHVVVERHHTIEDEEFKGTFDFMMMYDGRPVLLDIDTSTYDENKINYCDDNCLKLLILVEERIKTIDETLEFVKNAVSTDDPIEIFDVDWKQNDAIKPITAFSKDNFDIIPSKKKKEKDDKAYSFITKNVQPTAPGKKGVVGYVRVSTSMQSEEGMSMETQDYTIRQWVRSKGPDYVLKCICYDFGLSASTAERPGLERARLEVDTGDTLIVASLSRLARNVWDAVDIHREVKNKNAFLVLLDLNVDTNTIIGSLVFNIMSSLAQFERDQTKKRVSEVMDHLRSTNRLKKKPRFGFMSTGKGEEIVPCPDEQHTIEEIKKLREDNPLMSVTQLCKVLNNRKDLNRRNAKAWYVSTLTRIMDENKIPRSPFHHIEDTKTTENI